MADTIYKLAGVPLDYCKLSWPLYRGAVHKPVTLHQSLRAFNRLKSAIDAAKGIVTLEVTCSSRAGKAAPSRTVKIKGVRVLKIVKRTDGTCAIDLADARIELAKWTCKRDLNMMFRDGFLDGTEKPFSIEALKFMLDDALPLFAADAFNGMLNEPVPHDLLYSGSMLNKSLDDLMSRFGLSLTVGIDGKMRVATRDDIGPKPIKGKYTWLRGKEPGWLTSTAKTFRRARKFRFYYRRKHAMLVEIMHDGSNAEPRYLNLVMRQRYQDGEDFLSLGDLLVKYGLAYDAMNDASIGEAYMSENFQNTPMERDGSAERDALIRIIKNDWRRLYKIDFSDLRGGIGMMSDLAIGVFKKIDKPTDKQAALGLRPGDISGDVLPGGAIRGKWAEFLNVMSNKGLVGAFPIIGTSAVVNHEKDPSDPGGPTLPSAPYTGTWENEEAGMIRLKQEKLPDNNYAIMGRVTNEHEMKVDYVPARQITLPNGTVKTTRWGIDVPARSKAKIAADDAIALMIGTQRLPNDASRWEVIELDGFPDGDMDVQEFEVSELPALFDYIDEDKRTGAEHQEHAAAGGLTMGEFLNESQIRADANARRDQFMRQVSQKFAGPGTAIGVAALENERVGGSIDSIALQLDGVMVTTEITCANLAAADDARQKRAGRRREARMMVAGGKKVEAA